MWKRFNKWLNSYNYRIYQLFEDGKPKAYIATRYSFWLWANDERYFEYYHAAREQIDEWAVPKPEYTQVLVYKK
jgi:hypothetical protein